VQLVQSEEVQGRCREGTENLGRSSISVVISGVTRENPIWLRKLVMAAMEMPSWSVGNNSQEKNVSIRVDKTDSWAQKTTGSQERVRLLE